MPTYRPRGRAHEAPSDRDEDGSWSGLLIRTDESGQKPQRQDAQHREAGGTRGHEHLQPVRQLRPRCRGLGASTSSQGSEDAPRHPSVWS
jgi:hypothetical protein